MFVRRFRLGQFAGLEIDVMMTLAGAIDPIGPMQAGVEPLRRIGRGNLAREHGAEFFIEGEGVVFCIEIFALPAPIGPGAGKAVEHVGRRLFRAVALFLRQFGECLFIGNRTPQEGGDVVFLDPLQPSGNARLAEIFLRQNVSCHLAPGRGHIDIVSRKDDRAIRIADFAFSFAEFDVRIGALACLCIPPFDPH